MLKNKTTILNSTNIQEIGEYCDNYDVSEIIENNPPIEFEFNLKSQTTYYAVEPKISKKLHLFSKSQGLKPSTLLNKWLEEKLTSVNV
jgi:hypothetical protein